MSNSTKMNDASDKPLFTAIGLMSGTSMDGIDIACLQTDGLSEIRQIASMEYIYDAAMRRQIEAGLEDAKSIKQRADRPLGLEELERVITDAHIKALQAFLDLDVMSDMTIDLIGFHGQTVLHRPNEGLTVQLGNGEALAKALGVPVVYDMRANDMRHGGQGAPLVPAYHQALAGNMVSDESVVAIVNIGGISNVTFVGVGRDPVAFDCGPGNALIDQWMQREAGLPLDQGGKIALEGKAHELVVMDYLADSFFEVPAPKSLDRNDFSLDKMPALELSDGAMTLANVTAHAIFVAAKCADVSPDLWVLSGGGRHNQAIVDGLRMLAAGVGAEVQLSDHFGWNGDMMEAEAWAYLAVRNHLGLPLTWPTTTGCREPVSGGIKAPA